jgi:hypothetical protein
MGSPQAHTQSRSGITERVAVVANMIQAINGIGPAIHLLWTLPALAITWIGVWMVHSPAPQEPRPSLGAPVIDTPDSANPVWAAAQRPRPIADNPARQLPPRSLRKPQSLGDDSLDNERGEPQRGETLPAQPQEHIVMEAPPQG